MQTILTRPKVICLMVTEGREQLVAESIKLFRAQTYTNKHLLIYAYINDDLLQYEADDDITIVYYSSNFAGRLAKLRNDAVHCVNALHPDSKYVAIWDDDDIHAPERLEKQIDMLRDNPTKKICVAVAMSISDGCHMYTIDNLLCAGTMVIEREALFYKKLAVYMPQGHAEMDAFMLDAFGKNTLIGIDGRELYTQRYHDDNTIPESVKKSILNEAVLVA